MKKKSFVLDLLLIPIVISSLGILVVFAEPLARGPRMSFILFLDSLGIIPPLLYAFAPLVILRLTLRDYLAMRSEVPSFPFTTPFIKGVGISLVTAVVLGVWIRATCSGEECLGVIVGPPFIIIAGSAFSLVLVLTLILLDRRLSRRQKKE